MVAKSETLDHREKSFRSEADFEASITKAVLATLKTEGNFGNDKSKPWDKPDIKSRRPNKKSKPNTHKNKCQKSTKNPKWTSESFNDERYNDGIWKKREQYLKGGGKASGKPEWFKKDGFTDHQTSGWHRACCLCNMVGHSADEHENFFKGHPQCKLSPQ